VQHEHSTSTRQSAQSSTKPGTSQMPLDIHGSNQLIGFKKGVLNNISVAHRVWYCSCKLIPGIDLKFSTCTMEWDGVSVSMKPKDYWQGAKIYTLSFLIDGFIDLEGEDLEDDDDPLDTFAGYC